MIIMMMMPTVLLLVMMLMMMYVVFLAMLITENIPMHPNIETQNVDTLTLREAHSGYDRTIL